MLFDTKRKSLSQGSPVFISTRKFLPVKKYPFMKLTDGLVYLNNSLHLTRKYVKAGCHKNTVILGRPLFQFINSKVLLSAPQTFSSIQFNDLQLVKMKTYLTGRYNLGDIIISISSCDSVVGVCTVEDPAIILPSLLVTVHLPREVLTYM